MKDNDKRIDRERLAEKVVYDLQNRSAKSLKIAQKEMLGEKFWSKEVHEALIYYVTNWKTSVHPGLFSLACEAVGCDSDESVQVQAALSLLAAAFDVHDDIIDQSKVKDSKSTIFGRFGQNIALLVGNAFIMKGFVILSKFETKQSIEEKRMIFDTIKDLFFELGDAHALELKLRGKLDINPDEYLQILEMKAASVEADMRIGAIVGGGNAYEIQALGKYGRILGTLITLREEWIDIFEHEELHNRVKNECLPIPVLYALQNLESKRKILDILSQEEISKEDAEKIVEIVFETEEARKLKMIMKNMVKKALHHCSILQKTPAKEILITLVLSTLEDL